jgi:DNA gyrase subunit A
VKTLQVTEKTGKLVAIQAVNDECDLMIINKSGVAIRMSVADLRIMGRATQGVRLINLRDGDSIASVTAIPKTEEDPVENAVGEETAETTDTVPTTTTNVNPETEQ